MPNARDSKRRPRVIVAGLGDTGALVATRLARHFDVVGVATRPALVSGQELGGRLADPTEWRRTYLIPYRRFRRLDRIRFVQGRITEVDFEARQVTIGLPDGSTTTEGYDHFVIATGASNGFWRDDRFEDLASIDAGIDGAHDELASARTIAVIGGGATGVSVADNLALAGGHEVHLFHTGTEPLPGYHPRVRRWIMRKLAADGVVVHPEHRAIVPAGFAGDRLTRDSVEWSTGQPAFSADIVLWAVGGIRPHTSFLPASLLDDDGFVRVDEHLRLPDHPEVFAVGDVAASDPLRSSARNWGYRVVVKNVKALAKGRTAKLETYTAPEYRWGSVLGLQRDGLTVVQPNGKHFTIPRWFARPVLMGVFVQRILYGGLRRR